MQLRLNDQDDAVHEILRFKLPPWTLQEFITTCHDDEFYHSVSCMLRGLRDGVTCCVLLR